MIRTILSLLLAAGYLIVMLPVMVFLLILEKRDPDKRERIARPMIQGVFRGFIRLSGMRLQVSGLENVPRDRAVLFVGNHRSIFDIIATYPQLDRPVTYIAKQSMTKIPLFSSWFRFIGSLFFDRHDLRQGVQMLRDAADKITAGSCVFIFPEGTRNKGETDTPLLPFHEGSFRIAVRTGCPIVPVAISNMVSVFEKQFPKVRPASVSIRFGEPIDPSGFSKQERKHLGEYTSAVITRMLEEG